MSRKRHNYRAWRDVYQLTDGAGGASRQHRAVMRAQHMLQAIAPVMAGDACLTRDGCLYLGLRWKAFDPWAIHTRDIGG